ncbi:MAG: LPP20 family lipoprotein [Leptospirales bacterium]
MRQPLKLSRNALGLSLGAILFSTGLLLPAGEAHAGGKWWKDGHVDGYSQKDYMTAVGYGSTLSRAQKDAARNIATQLDSNIRSQYKQSSNRSGMSVSRNVKDTLAVKTHAKLYGLRNIRGRFVSSQGSYVAVVGVKRADLARYLSGRIGNLRATIDGLNSDLSGTSDRMRQIHDLAGLIRSKERAAFFDRERAVVTGGTPSDAYNVERDYSRLETLLSKHMTVSVSLRNGCGGTDRFVRHVAGAITDAVTRMGLLVVPSGGQIVIGGTVSARPMGAGFSRRYSYYILHYGLSMAAPDGTIWGSRVAEHKVAALTPSQGELLAVRQVADRGVGPLLSALRSRLFLDPKDPQFVAFPSDMGSSAAATAAGASLSGHHCDDFAPNTGGAVSSPGASVSASASASPASPSLSGLAPGYGRVIFSAFPPGAIVTVTWANPRSNSLSNVFYRPLGRTPFVYDLPTIRGEQTVVDANGNPMTRLKWEPVVYTFCFNAHGFYQKCVNGFVGPGQVTRLRTVTLQPQ